MYPFLQNFFTVNDASKHKKFLRVLPWSKVLSRHYSGLNGGRLVLVLKQWWVDIGQLYLDKIKFGVIQDLNFSWQSSLAVCWLLIYIIQK